VATYERVLERSISVEFVALGEPVPGLPDPMPALLAGMETYDSVVEMEETSSTFDVPLTSLGTFVREQVASQPA
jgi:hypothetical protein